jgi:hypothetical protein
MMDTALDIMRAAHIRAYNEAIAAGADESDARCYANIEGQIAISGADPFLLRRRSGRQRCGLDNK